MPDPEKLLRFSRIFVALRNLICYSQRALIEHEATNLRKEETPMPKFQAVAPYLGIGMPYWGSPPPI